MVDFNYRFKRFETYEEFEKRFKKDSLFLVVRNKKWLVHDNINLYINPSLICNADCGFCIAKTDDKLVCKKMLNSEKYIEKLDEVLSILKPVDPSVSICGGEPCLDDKLVNILALLKKQRVRKPILGTNGSGILENPELLRAINSSSLEHINLSRHHFDEDKNQIIMKIKKFISNVDLRKIIDSIDKKIRIRLQCNLLKGEVDSLEDCIKYLDWAIELGIANVAFSQLTSLVEGDIYAKSIVQYTKKKFISMIPILKKIDEHDNFRFIKQVIGPYYYAEIWRYETNKGEVGVVFKDADVEIMCELDYHWKNKNYANELIFHPNATLGSTWNPSKKIIIK